jgi:hypothetical protein
MAIPAPSELPRTRQAKRQRLRRALALSRLRAGLSHVGIETRTKPNHPWNNSAKTGLDSQLFRDMRFPCACGGGLGGGLRPQKLHQSRRHLPPPGSLRSPSSPACGGGKKRLTNSRSRPAR